MATNTTNFDLVKPAGSDNYDIDSFHNGSMDKIDSALQGLGTGLAIISKNNTHGAISSGEYVYVHGHGSLAEGLYKANTNIAANGTLTSSNLTAVSGGLGTQVASLSNQIKWTYAGRISATTEEITVPSDWKELYLQFLVFGSIDITFTTNISVRPSTQNHYTALGYLSQKEITDKGWGFSPGVVWVDFSVDPTNNKVKFLACDTLTSSRSNWTIYVYYKE